MYRLCLKSHVQHLSQEMHARTITPRPPTKSSRFGGFDSSRLLILRGGNSHVR